MVDSVSSSTSSQQIQQMQQRKKPDPKEMFNKLAQDVGADSSTGITKDELESYLQKLQSSGDSSDSKKAGMISDMIKNFDTLSGDSNTITADSMDAAFKSGKMKPPSHPPDGTAPTDSSDSTNYTDPSSLTSEDLTSPIDITV